jgi:OOP family OmpA-OmpF porin
MKLTPIAAALLLAPLAMSAQAEVTFTPFATYHWFDSGTVEEFSGNAVDQDIEDTDGYALALGYRFTPAWGAELHYGRTESELETVPALGLTATDTLRNSRLSLDGYYAFNAEGTFSPYVLLGVGQDRFRNNTGADIQDTLANAGLGAFWRFNDKVALRLEARNVHNIDADLDDQLALVGLEFSAGATKAADEPAQEEPAAEEAPAEAPVEQLAAGPADADGDGVADDADQCPATTEGATVDANGCELDTDKDGVADSADKCPDTKAGAAVDGSGCYQVLKDAVSIAIDVKFATGKAEIEGDASAEIQKVADFMKQYPNVNVTIEGHTDNRGSTAKNKALSQKRADAVKAEIVKLGVDATRLSAVGYGADKPIADNNTEEGRAQNRRVVASAKAQTETIKMKK